MTFDMKKYIMENRVVFPVVTQRSRITEAKDLESDVLDRLIDLEDLIGRSGRVALHPKERALFKDDWDKVVKQLKAVRKTVEKMERSGR